MHLLTKTALTFELRDLRKWSGGARVLNAITSIGIVDLRQLHVLLVLDQECFHSKVHLQVSLLRWVDRTPKEVTRAVLVNLIFTGLT